MYDGTTWKGWRWGTQPKKLNEQKWNVILNFNYQTRKALHLYLCLLPSNPLLNPDARLASEIACIPSQVKPFPGEKKTAGKRSMTSSQRERTENGRQKGRFAYTGRGRLLEVVDGGDQTREGCSAWMEEMG